MEQRILCGNEKRRGLVQDRLDEGAVLNAIDFLTVLDDHDGPAELRQTVLLLHCMSAHGLAAFDPSWVTIEGGVRIPAVRVRFARLLDGFDADVDLPDLSTDARDALNTLPGRVPDPAQVVLLLVEEPGDFSTYTLCLRDGSQPPTPFDLRLSEVAFSFKVECPTDYDCRTEPTCDVPAELPPEIDYLARDFPSFRRLMLDRMAQLQPTEPSAGAATLRATLVEVLAYAADRVAYHQDAVATEVTLGTARNRRSIRRHARLLDYPMHEGCNARAAVHLALQPGLRVGAGSVRRGATFLTRVPGGALVVGPDHLQEALDSGPQAFRALLDGPVLSAAHNTIAIHTWGEDDCCLRAGATTATLVDPGDLELAVGDFLVLEQVASPTTGRAADADLVERHLVRLIEVGPIRTDSVVSPAVDVREIRWHEDDALPHDLPVNTDDATVLVARGNLVWVDHGWEIAGEALALATRGSQGRVSTWLAQQPLTWAEPLPADPLASASRLLQQDPRMAVPDVALAGESEVWEPERDLLASDGATTAFVVENASSGRSWLRFGDDVHGRRPADLAGFTATYRIGNGTAGNVGAGAIVHLVEDPTTVDGAVVAALAAIRNPLPARAGTAPERLDEVQLYAPQAFRVQERAVTAEDWADVASRHLDVRRAVARFEWTGSWHTVFVTVDRAGGAPVDADFEAALRAELDRYRMAGIDLEIAGPAHVPLDISLSVCVEAGYWPEQVEAELVRVFGSGRLADGTLAFFHPDRYTFGQSVYLSALVARAMEVPGVRWVDASPGPPEHRFKRLWAPDDGTLANGVIRLEPLEIARCDSDPSFPEHGRIQFRTRVSA